ncbi:alpha/beta fold hydrolase [Streptococcus ruminicola]|uniref:alpha/beta fold hydrolase n=1 Tax=Streptococcus ruminicola TaxID=2686210 RepID=UPI0012F8A468|nr:alpha/beta hydrolase [Streptococcus ruminicola]QGX00052.1 alpha/beta fold hydrolase [Streptococcus ruminicola]
MEEYFIDDQNAYMRYQDFPGDGSPILFIHGLGCAGSFDYGEVVSQECLKDHRCILIDLLGAGYSDKPEDFDYRVSSHAAYLKSFVESLELTNLTIFGHSLGGPIAIELAKLCLDRVEHLILSEPNLDASVSGSSSFEIAAFSEKEFVDYGFRKVLTESQTSGNTMWAATLSNWSPYAVHRLSVDAVQGGEVSWRKLLYDLKIPKTVIFGRKSLPDDDYESLDRDGIPLKVIENVGHSMAWENPNGLAKAISSCLKK